MHVLIADDHPLVRRGLSALVQAQHPDWICSEAGTLDEALDYCRQGRVDLVSIDLVMPGVTGPECLASVRREFPATKIVVLTGAGDRGMMMECVAAGAHGYLLKSAAAEHLLRAMEVIVEGGLYFPSSLAEAWRTPDTAAAASSQVSQLGPKSVGGIGLPASLTERQREVLELLSQGCSTKEIARRMNLGIGTVKVHLAGVYKGLGARNRMEAIVKAGRAANG